MKRVYNFEYNVFEGTELMPNDMKLCDLRINQRNDEEIGTKLNAVFNYRISDEDELHDYLKVLSLFCRYCFNTDLNMNISVADQLNTFWPKIMNILDYRRARVEDFLDKIINEQNTIFPITKELKVRESNFPVVVYRKKKPEKNLVDNFDLDVWLLKLLYDGD